MNGDKSLVFLFCLLETIVAFLPTSTDGRIDEVRDGRIEGLTDGRINGLTDRRINGLTD